MTPIRRLRVAAVQALGAHPDPRVADRLLADWQSYLPAVRRAAVEAMLRDSSRVRRLLAEMEAGRVRPGDLDATQTRRLLQSGDPEIKALAGTLLSRPGSAPRGP